MAQENAAAENHNAVTLKLPPFWTSQPRVWFQQVEAQFALRHVTADDTKYYYVVAALDQETAQRLLCWKILRIFITQRLNQNISNIFFAY